MDGRQLQEIIERVERDGDCIELDDPGILQLAQDRRDLLEQLRAFEFETERGARLSPLEAAVYGWRTRALAAERKCEQYLGTIAAMRQEIQDATGKPCIIR
jgi:hypothetical protein